jgi:acyl-CoA synthetase (AMP-forming)/AMP-acid ligase II
MILGLERWAGSDAPALLDDGSETWLTYRELSSAVSDCAATIARLSRPVVFLFGVNDIPSAIVYLACLEAGAPVAPLRVDLAMEKAQGLVELYRPGVVCGIDPGPNYAPDVKLPLPTWTRRSGGVVAHPLLALLLSTSGSTGSPRMVRLSRSAVEANAQSIQQALGIGAADRSVLNLPMSYSYGLSVLNSHLLAGASVVMTELGLTERRYWDRLAAHKVTSMPGVPYVYQTLKRLGFETLAPSTLTTLTQAGGKLPQALAEYFHALMKMRGGRFFVMYGQTEATARIAILDSAVLPDRPESVGRAIPGGKITIEPSENSESGTGEIIYRGPNVMLGYAESKDDLAKGDELAGQLATGDIGKLDKDGFLYITGRLKRIAKVNGLRLNLDEVEALAARYAPAAALEADNILIVVLETVVDEALAQRARRELAQTLALPFTSLRVRCVEKLPVGSNGKLDREALRKVA